MPMPPPMPPGIAGALSSSGSSEMSASVVSMRPAMEEAFCKAERVTFAVSEHEIVLHGACAACQA